MKLWRFGLAGLAMAAGMAQAQSTAAVKFDFERSGLDVPHWHIELDARGEGTYEEFPAGNAAPVKQAIHVSADTLKRLDGGVAQAATRSCETKLKNVANTGKKTLTYLSASGDVMGECAYNFSDDPGVKSATDGFLSLQQTIQLGKRLAFKHRFDRLGLDSEIDALVGSVKAGHSIELGNIQVILNSIVNDADVIQRVRVKADALLKEAGITH